MIPHSNRSKNTRTHFQVGARNICWCRARNICRQKKSTAKSPGNIKIRDPDPYHLLHLKT